MRCNDPKILEKALRDLPEEIVDIYAQVLKDIPEDDKKTARLILIWLTYSVEPLTLEELASAVSIPSPQKVLDICTSSLVSLQPYHSNFRWRDVVQFDHFSVKEYLTSEKFRTSPETAFFYESPLIAHLTIAEISISRFISINNFNLATDESTGSKLAENFDAESWPPGKDPLLTYSTDWYKHIQQADAIDRSEAQSAETQQTPSVLRVRSHRLLCEEFSQSLENWYYLLCKERRSFDGFPVRLREMDCSPIIMACLTGLPNNVRMLLENVNPNHKSRRDGKNEITRPIHVAAISGHLEILGLLLEKGATLNQSELRMVARENIRQGADVLRDILKAWPSLKITQDTMMASAMNKKSKEMLSNILDHENQLTRSQLVAIAKNYRTVGQDHGVIGKIMSYGERIKCDRDEMLIAFLRWSECGPRIRIILDRYQPPISMTNSILESIFKNPLPTGRMLRSVFGYFRDVGVDIHFSPGTLEAALESRSSFSTLYIILNHAKSLFISTNTLRSLLQHRKGRTLMKLFMNHENCGYKYDPIVPLFGRERYFELHLRKCPNKITDETMQLASQLDETAMETLRKNARPNVILPSVDEIRDLVEKRRNGTAQQTESTLARMPSSEPAKVPQSEDS